MASIHNLIKQRENLADTRISEMSAIMNERIRHADDRVKLMSDMMQRRISQANNRMIDLMTTMQELTLGVKAIVSQTAAAPACTAPAPLALNVANMTSTSAAPPPAQVTYRRKRNLVESR